MKAAQIADLRETTHEQPLQAILAAYFLMCDAMRQKGKRLLWPVFGEKKP